MQELDYKAMGQRIRHARQKKNITQEKLGELCGLSTAHIGHIERGTRIPSLETAFCIAATLEVSMDYLLLDAAREPKAVLAALASTLQGKSETQVNRFLSTVKALADKIEEL